MAVGLGIQTFWREAEGEGVGLRIEMFFIYFEECKIILDLLDVRFWAARGV